MVGSSNQVTFEAETTMTLFSKIKKLKEETIKKLSLGRLGSEIIEVSDYFKNKTFPILKGPPEVHWYPTTCTSSPPGNEDTCSRPPSAPLPKPVLWHVAAGPDA